MAPSRVSLEILAQLAAILAPLSLVAVSGAFTVVPEIHRQVVEVHAWLTDSEFAELFALAQAAPGPNILVVALIGWQVAGPIGGLVALLAMTGPSSLLAFVVAHTWRRLDRGPWRDAIQDGLAPVAIGLVLASGFVLVGAADHTPAAYLVTAATSALVLRGGVHPLIMMGIGALCALGGWI